MRNRLRTVNRRGAGLALVLLATALGAAPLELPLTDWQFKATGNFAGHLDRRGLYQIVHPLAPAKAGDYGRLERRVTLPATLAPPFTLRFYVNDNIYGEGHGPGAIVDLRRGHRFEQALVDGKVVWASDTATNTPLDSPLYTLVDLTPHVRPGQAFTLALQLWQEVDSARQMPDDLVRLGIYAGTTQTYAPLPREAYGVRSYWGDVAILDGPPPDPKSLACRWQPPLKRADPAFPPRVAPAAREQATLPVELRDLLAGPWPWPVAQGIPFPQGAVADTRNLALTRPDGRPVPAEFAALSRWPDGSLRWVLADFALAPDAAPALALAWGRDVAITPGAPTGPVRAEDDLRAGNGRVRAEWPTTAAGSAPGALTLARGTAPALVAGLTPYLNIKDKAFAARWLKAEWLSRSPARAEMQASGELVAADGDRYGACRLRLTLFAGSPLVRLLFTIVNERAEPVPEDTPDTATVKSTRGLVGETRPLTAVVTAYGLRLVVPGAEPRQAGTGWFSVAGQGGALSGVLRYFRHVWPVALEPGPEGVDIQLFKPGDTRLPTYSTYGGEAKTHELWLALTESVPDRGVLEGFAARVETPPRLDATALIRASGAWGELPRLDGDTHTAEYALIAERCLAPFYEATLEDIRHYGGYPAGYNNFYWNRLHSMYVLYGMTGERKWYDWAERSSRHYMDVCLLHWSPDGAKVGGKVRNADKFLGIYLVHQNPHPLFDHWNLTGDPDGLRLGRASADFVLTDPAMRRETDGRCARVQGWPLMAMVRAWQETGDARYGEHARHIVDVATRTMEQRRGAYLENHGSASHLGIVPFMSGILCTGLRQYHQWTGEARAGAAVVQNAEAIFAEMHDPDLSRTRPYLDYYYSPCPYLCGADGRETIAHLNPNLAAAQAYAACLTDDAGLADIAWRTWQAYMQTAGWAQNSYDYLYDLHAVLYWLDRAPVPDRTPAVRVGRLWRQGTAAPEVWLDRPDSLPLTLEVRWTAYEKPYHRGHPLPAWPEYCRRQGLRGELQLRDAEDRVVAAAPMDFAATPHGATVTLTAATGAPGLYRVVPANAAAVPVRLILLDLSPQVAHWGVPIDRGWLCEATDYCFPIPPASAELALRYGLLTPWEKVTVQLLDATGTPALPPAATATERWQTSWLDWKVPVPAGAQGQVWRFRQTPAGSAIVRIAGIGPLVSLAPEAAFVPARVPPPLAVAAADAPANWREPVTTIEAGKSFTVPRGPATGDGAYRHLNAREGTLEFWLRADTTDDSMDNLTFLRCGRLQFWRRTQLGTYFNLGDGFLQSGFVIRPRVWYHVALTWHLGDAQRQPVMNLFIDGVPMLSVMQTPLPEKMADWTGDSLVFGTSEPLRLTGLRIAAVARDAELRAGRLSPPPDAQTLFWQHTAARP